MSSLPKTQEFNSVVPLPSPHWDVSSLTLPPESLPAQSAPCPAGHPRVRCGAVVSDAVIAAHRARAGKGGLQHLGALKARPWQKCQEPNTRCCCFFQHTHTHTHEHACTPLQNHMCTPMLVCSHVYVCICAVHTRLTHMPCTPLHTSLHTQTHTLCMTCTTPHVCAHRHPSTPHRECVSSHQHITSGQPCVRRTRPETGAPGRGHPMSCVQRVKWPGPGYAQAALPSAPCGGGWAQEGALAQTGQNCVNTPAPSGNSLRKVLLESVIRYNFKTTTIVRRKRENHLTQRTPGSIKLSKLPRLPRSREG